MVAWKEDLAAELRDARGTATQAEVAARSGVSDRTIGLIEQKKLKTRPRADTIVRLALATGSDPVRWLTKIGMEVSPAAIDQLRGQVRTITRLDRLKDPEEIEQEVIADIERIMRTKLSEAGEKLAQFESPPDIKEQLKKYVHDHVEAAMSAVEPAHKIRKELHSYVDTRLHAMEQILKDLTRRLDHLQSANTHGRTRRRAGKGKP